MTSQRSTLVDHDELAELADDEQVYRNQDGQPPPVLQLQEDSAFDHSSSADESPRPTPAPSHTPSSLDKRATAANPSAVPSQVVFVNHAFQHDNTSAQLSSTPAPRVIVTQPNGVTATHPTATIVQPRASSHELSRALKEKDIVFLQVFAAMVCICFPFTGVIAVAHSFRSKRLFDAGEIQEAVKFASKAERFILCTIILSFLFLVMLIAVVEASVNREEFEFEGWRDWPAGGHMMG